MKKFCICIINRSAYDFLALRSKIIGIGEQKRIFIAKPFCAHGFNLISLYFPL